MRRGQRRVVKGFTLMELVLAMMLAGLVVTGMVLVFRSSLQMTDAVSERVRDLRAEEAGLAWLDRVFGEMVDETAIRLQTGDEGGLELWVENPGVYYVLEQGEVRATEMALWVEEEDGESALWVRLETQWDDEDAEDVDELRFALLRLEGTWRWQVLGGARESWEDLAEGNVVARGALLRLMPEEGAGEAQLGRSHFVRCTAMRRV